MGDEAVERKPRRWGLVFGGILLALMATSSVAAFRVVNAAPLSNPVPEGFPIVAPPSFAVPSPPPLARLQSAIQARIPATPAPASPSRSSE